MLSWRETLNSPTTQPLAGCQTSQAFDLRDCSYSKSCIKADRKLGEPSSKYTDGPLCTPVERELWGEGAGEHGIDETRTAFNFSNILILQEWASFTKTFKKKEDVISFLTVKMFSYTERGYYLTELRFAESKVSAKFLDFQKVRSYRGLPPADTELHGGKGLHVRPIKTLINIMMSRQTNKSIVQVKNNTAAAGKGNWWEERKNK